MQLENKADRPRPKRIHVAQCDGLLLFEGHAISLAGDQLVSAPPVIHNRPIARNHLFADVQAGRLGPLSDDNALVLPLNDEIPQRASALNNSRTTGVRATR